MQDNHPFDLEEVKNLVSAIQKPLAVFRSATHIGSNVILTELKHNGKNFVVAIETNRSKRTIQVNDIRSVHYRSSDMHIVNWINENLADYIAPNFKNDWLEPMKRELRSKQRYNSAEVRKQLSSAAKIVDNFENPPIEDKNSVEDDEVLFSRDVDEEVNNTARDFYERNADSISILLSEANRDKLVTVKLLQDAIERETGKKIEDWENYWMIANQTSSKSKAEYDVYKREHVEPLAMALAELEKSGMTHKEVIRYMQAKHGLERNRELAFRDV